MEQEAKKKKKKKKWLKREKGGEQQEDRLTERNVFKPTNTETWIGAVQSLYLAYNNHSCFSSVFCFFLSLILVFMQPTLSDEIDRNSNAETTDF